jgi:hypothetical protein
LIGNVLLSFDKRAIAKFNEAIRLQPDYEGVRQALRLML